MTQQLLSIRDRARQLAYQLRSGEYEPVETQVRCVTNAELAQVVELIAELAEDAYRLRQELGLEL